MTTLTKGMEMDLTIFQGGTIEIQLHSKHKKILTVIPTMSLDV